MATLGELNILLNIKGLSSVKSGLKSVSDQTKETSNEFKSAAESASVFEAAFKKQDIQLKQSQKQFKAFTSDLRSVGRELTQIGSIIRNDSLVVIGAFSAAFVSSRAMIPQVDTDLNNLAASFRHISESIARAAEPSLKSFTDLIKKLEIQIESLRKTNPEVINSFLKFAGVGVVIGSIVVVLGTMAKSLYDIIKLLTTLGVITTTGAIATAAGTFLGIAGALGAIYLEIKHIIKELNKLDDADPIKKFLNRMKGGVKGKGGEFGGKGASGSWDSVDLGTIKAGGGAHQMSKEELSNSMSAAAAQIENVQQKAQQAIENTLTMANAVREQIGGVFASLAEGIGQSVGQAIVFGQNFLDSMVNVLKNLAASIISMLVEVIAKIIILRAMGVVGPIPAAALFGGGAGFGEAMGGTGIGKATTGFFGNLFKFADGGIVTKPTIGLVGEAGPEAIVPLDKMNQMGGGNFTINSDVIFLQDQAAMDRFFRKGVEAMKRITNRRTGGTTLAF